MGSPIGSPLTNPPTSPLREAPFPSAANFSVGAHSVQPAAPSCATPAACTSFPLAPPAHALATGAETLPRMAIPAVFPEASAFGAAASRGWTGVACGADALRLGCKRKGGAWMGGDGGAGGADVGIPGVGVAGRWSATGMDGVVGGMRNEAVADMADLGNPAKRARLQLPVPLVAPSAPADPAYAGACSMDTISGSPHTPLHAQLQSSPPPTALFPLQEADNQKAVVLYSPPVIPSLSTGAGAGAGTGRRAEREAMAGASASLAARAAMRQWPIEKLKAAWAGASPMEKRVLGGMIGSLLQGQPIQILGGSKLLEALTLRSSLTALCIRLLFPCLFVSFAALQLHPPVVAGRGLGEDDTELKAQEEGGEDEDKEDELEQSEQQPDSLMATADAMNLEHQKVVSSSCYEGNNGEDMELAE
ncbi:unnamed protein product [Closterium sp. NIES-64]|nr:unnamed protein product [Closterium sp. NIES-64]